MQVFIFKGVEMTFEQLTKLFENKHWQLAPSSIKHSYGYKDTFNVLETLASLDLLDTSYLLQSQYQDYCNTSFDNDFIDGGYEQEMYEGF